MDERAAFEAGIDANPLDGDHRLVYGDWLDEHGEHDEAAFQRSMGEWMKIHGPSALNKKTSINQHAGWTDEYDWGVSGEHLPNGVSENELPSHAVGVYTTPELQRIIPSLSLTRNERGNLVWKRNWKTYRQLEGAFRHSFMANLRRRQPEQLSRIARSVRKMRKR